jgi:hypothetical protein
VVADISFRSIPCSQAAKFKHFDYEAITTPLFGTSKFVMPAVCITELKFLIHQF